MIDVCLDDALSNASSLGAHGIWGGLSELERKEVVRLRKAGAREEATQYIADQRAKHRKRIDRATAVANKLRQATP